MREGEPIDKAITLCIDVGNAARNEAFVQQIDDPYLERISILVNTSLQKLVEVEEHVGITTKTLFLVMSFLDPDYLFKEMFTNISDVTKSANYVLALETLQEMGFLTLEKR